MERWRKKDPLLRFERYLEKHELLSAAKRESLEESIQSDITKAIAEVEAAAPPERESLFEDVYGELPWHLEEQRKQMLEAEAPAGH